MSAKVRAFGGGPLQGSKWVRIAYFDESGVGDPTREPYAVVAGMIIHGDVDYLPLHKALNELVAEFPSEHQEKRFIHTAQLYGGYYPFTEKNGWNEAKRFGLMEKLAALPNKLQFPVIWGHFQRSRFVEDPRNITNNESHYSHVMAAVNCTLQVERAMREGTPENEICSIVMEKREHTQKLLTDAQRFLANPPEGFVQGKNRHWMPISRIIGTPHFEQKEDAGLLQMADFCALVIKRQLMGDTYITPYFQELRKAIVFSHADPAHAMY